ncbi:annexin A7/11 protein [Dioscorea alata]|uniref:Annexin A7/11 protein n=1 Tax=Dioscorea alata TaxID=55571 RepID=A0ACB7TYN9_DIOAL|nr:annexin A7/11 protein [Dioscorea alata]
MALNSQEFHTLLEQALSCRSTAAQRQIKEKCRNMFSENLVEHLQGSKLGTQKNEMCEILCLWMLEPRERDALVAKEAIEQRDQVDHKALVEIYTLRKSNQLFLTKQAYLKRFKRHLDRDIISETAHSYQKILEALATSHRSHHADTSHHIAKCDAKRLYEAGKGITGYIDESIILEIFSKRSIPQLRLTFSSYKHIYGHEYIKTLKKENSAEFEESLRVVIKCMNDPTRYYSKMLHMSMKGGVKNRSALSRVMVGSTDVGMEDVKNEFQRRYGTKLEDYICETIPVGVYKDFLLALVNN